MVTLYLVRHGQTRLNAAGLLRGHTDEPLDDVGHAQARRLGELFANVPIGVIVSSPLRRARQTAEPIAFVAGLPATLDDRLIDRDYGPWTARSRSEAEADAGDLENSPQIEPSAAVEARALAALDDVAGQLGRLHVAGVVVAHDIVNRLALARLVPSLGDPDAVPQRTGCWNRLERAEFGWRALELDAVPGDSNRLSGPARGER